MAALNESSPRLRHAPLPRVMLLLPSLVRGGAERQAVTLACALHEHGWPVTVACFYAGGPLGATLQDRGVPLFDLGKRGRWDVIGFLFRLWRLLRRERPDILHGYLPTPNLVALLMRRYFPKMRIVWGVRASNIDLAYYDWLARPVQWLEARGSRHADLVIANSECGAHLSIAQGFPESTMRVIPNGIDTDYFCCDATARARVRHEWEIPDGAMLVGLVGRLDPMKAHPTFLAAAAALAKRDRRWRFVCVGGGPPDYKAKLVEQGRAFGLGDRLVWADARDDMPAVYSALDMAVSSSSFGEGFSNAIAEAMACGRPCVITEVGDSAMIVGELGVTVPPGDPSALAAGIERLAGRLRADGDAVAINCRARIVGDFSVARLLEHTEAAFRALRFDRPVASGASQ
ncbi:MAG: glycosyltransferase [Gammaproteobacteria bacterium]